jgi:hypothetical protein
MDAQKIVILHHAEIIQVNHYEGICDGCAGQVFSDEPIYLLKVAENDLLTQYYVLDILQCPFCSKRIQVLKTYKSMEVSAEFQAKENHV